MMLDEDDLNEDQNSDESLNEAEPQQKIIISIGCTEDHLRQVISDISKYFLTEQNSKNNAVIEAVEKNTIKENQLTDFTVFGDYIIGYSKKELGYGGWLVPNKAVGDKAIQTVIEHHSYFLDDMTYRYKDWLYNESSSILYSIGCEEVPPKLRKKDTLIYRG